MADMHEELKRALARAWEDGKTAASRGIRNNPFTEPTEETRDEA